jgi:hypothetical protein
VSFQADILKSQSNISIELCLHCIMQTAWLLLFSRKPLFEHPAGIQCCINKKEAFSIGTPFVSPEQMIAASPETPSPGP